VSFLKVNKRGILGYLKIKGGKSGYFS
jgi:hypothetical protein